jgi:hypothetical protein
MSTESTADVFVEPVAPTKIGWWKSIGLLAMTGITLLACYRSPAFSSQLEAGIDLNLPIFVGDYSGMPQEITLAEKTILPPDTEFARKNYRTLSNQSLNCQIVMSGGGRRSIHQPEICLPGQGWTVMGKEVVPIALKDGKKMDAMVLRLSREFVDSNGKRQNLRSLFMYWFVGKDRTTPHHFERILLTSWDRVVHNVNHRWAYVTVSAEVLGSVIPGAESDEATLKRLKEFAGQIEPEITRLH